jgi:hypothetical protein
MFRTCVQAVFVALIMLSFVFIPAVADQTLPVEETDSAAGYLPDNDHAYLISPVDENVYTRTPKYYFSRPVGATEYFIQVWSQGPPFESAYTIQGAGVCNDYYCYLQSLQKLKPRSMGYSGNYTWQIQALVGGVWYGFSEQATFTVLSKGFNDSFSVSPTKWHTWNGNWTWNQVKGRMQTPGKNEEYSSLYHQEAFLNYEYTVRMKRKVDDKYPNSIIVMGLPDPIGASGQWSDAVYFSYKNEGYWALWTVVGGVIPSSLTWHEEDVINEFGWNELKVRVYRPYVDLWINGKHLGWYEVTSVNGEYVGVDMYSTGVTDDKFLVDWATLVPIKFSAFGEHDRAMQLGQD